MGKKITLKDLMSYTEGNAKQVVDKFDLLPKYKKEQVEWRKSICVNDCMIEGKCKYCGCSVPGKLYVKKSCNDGERFPDMMDELEWNYYKKINGIVI
jgi:hypothetical protein